MRKPVIGITTGLSSGVSECDPQGYESYANSIREAGGDPVFIYAGKRRAEDLEKLVHDLDGLLLSGGKDIHPAFYEPLSASGDGDETDTLLRQFNMDCDPERDVYEIPLARMAYGAHLPILGICRGFQVLNVVLGGSLIKDIRTSMRHKAYTQEDSLSHKAEESATHPIAFDPGSRIVEMLGRCLEEVNSRHHQGFTESQKAACLRATASAPDGLVEAVESDEHPWAVAVQWHPEREKDPYIHEPCKALFRAFICSAREKR